MATRPDVILLMCDQWRPDCLGFLGHPLVRTPNLDALAARGVAFRNAYCASPLCSPARASWLTGRYPHGTGQLRNGGPRGAGTPGGRLDPRCVTLGDAFKAAGYRCGIVGPWHMGDDHIPQHGFEDFWETFRYQGKGRPDRFFDYVAAQGLTNVYDRKTAAETRGIKSEPGYGKFKYTAVTDLRQQRTTYTVGRGLAFLERHAGEPCFLFLSIKDPHPIIAPPAELLNLYPPDRLSLPDAFGAPLVDKPGYQSEPALRLGEPLDPAAHRRVMAHYFALLTHVDNEVGRLVSALKEKGRFENTIIAFISDHGEMLGEQGFIGKRLFYEPSIKVPCILSWPAAVAQGRRWAVPFAGVDLAPTLVELAGVDGMPDVHGRSLAAALRSGTSPAVEPVFAELCGAAAHQNETDAEEELAHHVMVRDGDWKYVRTRNDRDELYHLASDPGERTNLAAQPAHQHQVELLREQIRAMLRRTGPGPYRWFAEN